MPKAIGLITANYTTASKDDVFSGRPVASMPYLGRYRLVDFALSNMVNAGIRNVGMVKGHDNLKSVASATMRAA